VSLSVEVMWLLRGLEPDFRTIATAKRRRRRSIQPRSYTIPPFRVGDDPELGADRRPDFTRVRLRCGLAVWLWDARERDAFAGKTTLAFASVVIPDRKRSYIPADIPGSRSWSAGSWKRAPARRLPLRPPE
jgi:hypothetical protein